VRDVVVRAGDQIDRLVARKERGEPIARRAPSVPQTPSREASRPKSVGSSSSTVRHMARALDRHAERHGGSLAGCVAPQN